MNATRAEISKLFTDISREFPMEDYYYREYFPRSINRYIDILMLVPRISGGEALDVGCGYGDINIALTKLGYKVFATDLFTITNGSIEDRMSKYNVTFQRHNIEAEALPFEDNCFDLVIFSEVLEHLNYSPLIPLQEIRRVLKNGGKLILSTPNIANSKAIAMLLMGRNVMFMDLERYYITPKPIVWHNNLPFFNRHNRLYNTKELKQLVNRAGLKVDNIHYSYAPGSIGQAKWKKAIHWILGEALHFTQFSILGDFIVVVATKEAI